MGFLDWFTLRLENKAIKQMEKEGKDVSKFKELQKTKKRLDKTLDAKTKKQLKNNEIPDVVKRALEGKLRNRDK